MEHTLFNQQSAASTFDLYLREMVTEINSKGNDYILNVDVEQWRQYFIDKYDFIPLTVYPEKATFRFIGKGKARIEKYGREYETETYRFEVIVPFTGWSFLFLLSPSTRTINHPRVNTPSGNNGDITASFTLYEQNDRQFEHEKQRLINAISVNVPNINKDLAAFKANVINTFNSTYAEKKEKVLAENSFFEKLNLKVETSTDRIFKVSVVEKKKVPEPIVDKKTERKYTDSPTLPDEFYNDVLDVINTFFKSVEKKPSTYEIKDEEGLRDYVLPTLETRYNNLTVTGETFNKGGKTDILLKYKDGTNLFVAECKYWKGEAVFHETINQLFDRYLTWRDSKVAIIFFVTNKEFSKVLSTIQESVKKHPYFFRENEVRGESSFSYLFHFPTDKGKYVFTEIMAFHFL
ncbi:hypothetical protein [Lacibacter sp. H407]|uniref:hypothetical protein n=1 Tax=Lacibacter sp. H407 TaxID=3133423 RepID=UPI0030BCAAFE